MKGKILRSSGKFLLLWVVGILLSVQAFAQSMTVKGIVKDNTGFGVIGASVQIKGTTKGAITDLDGNFTFEANTPSKPTRATSSSSATSAIRRKSCPPQRT